MLGSIKIIFLSFFAALVIFSAVPSYAAPPNNLSQKYLGDLTEEEYNKFFKGTFFFSSVERALIQKAIAGKIEEAQESLKLEERRQKEILDPSTFRVEKRERGTSYRPRTPVQPRAQQPRVQQPRTQQPRAQQPRAQQPRAQQPRVAPPPVDNRNFTLNQEQQKTAQPVIPPQRLIVLSGVIFRKKDDWVVWINGQKVTPDNYLPEIIDIKVENSSYVHLKWYDIGLQEVISVTLRPNQIYDITTGVLLPG